MPRRSTTPPPRVADWAPDLTHKALTQQLAVLEGLRGRAYREAENEEKEWMNLTLNVITHGFGEASNNVNQFHHAKWAGEHSMGGLSEGQIQQNFEKRIDSFAGVLRSSLTELELMGAGVAAGAPPARVLSPAKPDSREIFLVHGRDDAAKESVARFLESLDCRPIILHEQPNMGRTVIEKFEAHSDVRYAVVLLTPDDFGGLASGEEPKPRARQNVILELGYFIGKLGRARVCALFDERVEIPSDIHGVIFVRYDPGGGWRLRLAGEIRAAGIPVDLNRA
jgi:predicted nucleotide-binding protein